MEQTPGSSGESRPSGSRPSGSRASGQGQLGRATSQAMNQAAGMADAGSAAMNEAASAFAARGQQSLSEATNMLSARLGDLAGYLQTRSLDEITGEMRRMARENPALFIAGGVAAGLLLSRFFKASSEGSGRSSFAPDLEDEFEDEPRRFEDEPGRYGSRRYSAPDPEDPIGPRGDSWSDSDEPGNRGGLI